MSRTLVKSPPELWAECSQASTLARHLDQFGELKITRLEPEIAVAWEGERASGTVRLEPAGWGTKVVLKARPVPDPAAAPASAPVVTPPAPPPLAESRAWIESPPPEPPPPPRPPPRPEDLPPAAEAADAPRELVPAPAPPIETSQVETPRIENPPVAIPPDGDDLPARRGFFGRLIGRFQVRSAQQIELRQVDPVDPVDLLEPVEPAEPEPAPVPQRQLPTRRASAVEIARFYGDDPSPAQPNSPAPSDPPALPDPPAAADPAPDPEAEELSSALTAALDSLGQAHHRPFSRG